MAARGARSGHDPADRHDGRTKSDADEGALFEALSATGRQTLHHDWLSDYRGLQTPLFILSLGIELAHSFNLNVSG
jgi:hypothetical protein